VNDVLDRCNVLVGKRTQGFEMHLTMFREPSQGGATLSKLFHGLEFVCDVLEDEVRELPGVPVSGWKIHGVTAIPHGTYQITLEFSQRFGPDTITLLKVPGYQYIRGHAGNTSADTEGCLLFGTRNSACTVARSRDALAYVKRMVQAALQRGERVDIEIIPADGVQA
jgi:hypothetical protein